MEVSDIYIRGETHYTDKGQYSVSYQSTIPSPTDVKRESVLGSMGRTCLQSGSFSRALLIQFTKANRSSSESEHKYRLKAKQPCKVTEMLKTSCYNGLQCFIDAKWSICTWTRHGTVAIRDKLMSVMSGQPTRERVLCAFARQLRRPSNSQDAFFSVDDLAESFCYFAASQLLDDLEQEQTVWVRLLLNHKKPWKLREDAPTL